MDYTSKYLRSYFNWLSMRETRFPLNYVCGERDVFEILDKLNKLKPYEFNISHSRLARNIIYIGRYRKLQCSIIRVW